LPVLAAKNDILRLIREHQVIIISGETGSGKTTQLPQLCLALGLGARGTIAHTQPRRIAARSVAARIAEELDTPLGDAVGYQVRFDEKTSDSTVIKLMTDGMLLAETLSDPYLAQYEVIIVDEAHERSLNIDFLLGYLHRLAARRPDLKIIITSATIDAEKFAAHFGGAPVLNVSGRTYPVEIRYRPPGEDEDMADAIVRAVLRRRIAQSVRLAAYKDASALTGKLAGMTHAFARLEAMLGPREDLEGAPARFRAKFAAEVGAKRTPLARHLEGVKLGAAELRDILRGERPELSPYASLDLSAEVPQELAEDAGFSRPVLKDDGEIFYDYWLWFFRHARKRAVQQRKEAAD